MAKQDAATKARKAREQASKSAHNRALTADKMNKVGQTLSEAMAGGQVINLQQQAGTKGKPSKGFDESVPLAGGGYLNPEAKPVALKVKPAEGQIAFVERMVEAKDIGAQLHKLGNDLEAIQWKVSVWCVVIAYILQRDGDNAIPMAADFLNQCQRLGKGFTMIRSEAIKAWLLDYAPVSWDKVEGIDGKTFVINKAKRSTAAGVFGRSKKRYIEERLERPFWLHKPEKELTSFDFKEALKALLKRARTASENPEKFKSVENMDIFDKFEKEAKRFLTSKKDDADGKADKDDKAKAA